MKQNLLSLALALTMCLGLTVPAFAAGTVKVMENEEHGVKVTMNGFLREETRRYNVYDDFRGGMTAREFTVCVVEDNSTVTLEALEGRKYADASLQGLNKWTVVTNPNAPEREAWNAFVDNMESYAYDGGESWGWDYDLGCFHVEAGPAWPLEQVVTSTVSPTEEIYILYLDLRYGIAWMCESDYAKLVPVDGAQPTVPTVGGFTDVKTDDWFAEPVLWAVEEGITAGTSETTFSPTQDCTQSQILSFLWRAQGEPAPSGTVSGSEYYAKAAQWAQEQGLTDDFSAEADCTRAMVVTYLWKLAGSPKAGTSDFTDVPANADYAQAVAWAVEQGVTAGTSATTFSPDAVCTRGQIVSFLYRALAQ